MAKRPAPSSVVPFTQPDVSPLVASNWPAPNDVSDLNAIVDAQALTIADNAALLARYQGIMASAQAVPATTAVGTASTTQLTLSNVVGVIKSGQIIAGTGVPTGTSIVAQVSGVTGGNGVYTTSQATTAAGSALTFTPSGAVSPWPAPQDAPTLTQITQSQTAIIRNQTALIQQYQDLMNVSDIPVS